MGYQLVLDALDEPDAISRAERLARLSDEDLLSAHAKLHAPAIKAEKWISLLEEEMRRRGLIKAN